ncbi:hypothetical protein CMUS01_09746 [Colletotrichum musicola]|uniref:Uncharacterized protein n=1 Tax=Colletotrichum musicola TaxID=2175873 RepID=A0A8H6K5T5_9PEZI|nr:hypothetical protein CMUS01_09746 [Colletotrichum musicola]
MAVLTEERDNEQGPSRHQGAARQPLRHLIALPTLCGTPPTCPRVSRRQSDVDSRYPSRFVAADHDLPIRRSTFEAFV